MADWLRPYQRQRQNARALFGSTSIVDPTSSQRVTHPNVSATFVVKVADYWLNEAAKISPVWTAWAVSGMPSAVSWVAGFLANTPDSAVKKDWRRTAQALATWRDSWSGKAGLLPETAAAEFWGDVKNYMLGFTAVSKSPTNWEIVSEAVSQTVSEIGQGAKKLLSGGSSFLLKLALFAGLGFGAVSLLSQRRRD